MRSRAKLAAALASVGVVGLGWAATAATAATPTTATVTASVKPGARLNARALPALRGDVVAANGVVATVSAATYTAEEYSTSVQSTLDRAA